DRRPSGLPGAAGWGAPVAAPWGAEAIRDPRPPPARGRLVGGPPTPARAAAVASARRGRAEPVARHGRASAAGRGARRSGHLTAARDRTPPVVPLSVDEVIRGSRTPLALVRLLEGRSNAERESAVARYLRARGVPFTLHPFSSDEGSGENFAVDLGAGERVLLL